VTDGADGTLVKAVKQAAEAQGASVKIVTPKIGGVSLEDGSPLKADGQLVGTPSVLFDAVALVLSEAGCIELVKDSSAIDFASHAFTHLKAIGFLADAKPLLEKAEVKFDEAALGIDGYRRGESRLHRAIQYAPWARASEVRTSA
jgi:catalase